MAFRRSPVRSRSGPPTSARLHPVSELRLASQPSCAFIEGRVIQPRRAIHQARRRLPAVAATCPPERVSAEVEAAKEGWQATSVLTAHLPRKLPSLIVADVATNSAAPGQTPSCLRIPESLGGPLVCTRRMHAAQAHRLYPAQSKRAEAALHRSHTRCPRPTRRPQRRPVPTHRASSSLAAPRRY